MPASQVLVDSEDGPDPIDVAVGNRIRVRRKWLGVSQSALAEHLGVSFQQVQKYERGSNRVSASMLVKIAQRIETTVGELVGETASVTADPEMARLLSTTSAREMLQALAIMKPSERTALVHLAITMVAEHPHPANED